MRRWQVVLAAVAGVAFVVASLALRVQSSGSGTTREPRRSPPGTGLGASVDRRLPAVPLVDDNGRRTSLAAFRGRWVVLVPSMTLCHEVCPLTTAAVIRLDRLMAAAGVGGRFVAVTVSVDPWRDTPRRLRAYRRMTGADFPMLTGDVGSLRRLWSSLGIDFERVSPPTPPDRDWMTGRPERFDVEHTDGAFVIDPRGVERLAVPGMPAVGGKVRPRLSSLLDRDGERNLRHPSPGWSAVALARRLQRMMGPTDERQAPTAPRGGTGLIDGARLAGALEALGGHPALVNVWASWCPPCREELPLLGAAEKRFGARIAFLGADFEDDAGSAGALLRRVASDYPSYPVDEAEVDALLGPVQGTPITFLLDRSGTVVGEHVGAYGSTAALDADLLRLEGGG